MKAKEFEALLNELGACSSAIGWAHGKTLHVVWETCDRGDWLLWLAGKMADKKGWPTRKQVVLAACACAETALKYVPKGEDRPKKAIQTARAWARGKATLEEVRAAAYAAAYAAAAYAAAAYAAAYAADAAAAAYAAYAYADAAASAAAEAAYAAADAAYAAHAAAYAAAAYADALADCAKLVRKHLKEPRA